MAETLYRRNPNGMMEMVVPKAQGKAAALSAYLAQGGTPYKFSGRYKQGPMKGMNTDQATAEFERLWANAPDEIKQKYADRSSGAMTDLAPSERQMSAMPGYPAPSSPTQAKTVSGNSSATPSQSQTVVTPPVKKAESDFPPAEKIGDGSAESRQQIIKALPKPTVVTKTAAAPAQPAADQSAVAPAATPPATVIPAVPAQPSVNQSGPVKVTVVPRRSTNEEIAARNLKAFPGNSLASKGARLFSNAVDVSTNALGKAYDGVSDFVTGNGSSGSPEVQAQLDRNAAEQAKSDALTASRNAEKMRADAAASEAKRTGVVLPTNQPPASTPSATKASATSNSDSILQPQPIQKNVDPSAMVGPTASTPARINKLTGLPMGYRPGDAVAPDQAGAAADSVRRQTAASIPQTIASNIAKTGRSDGYQATSQRQDWDRENAAAKARADGTMGDYMNAQGRPDLAKAFPNAMTNEQADAELAKRNPNAAMKALPVGSPSIIPPQPQLSAIPARRPLFAKG